MSKVSELLGRDKILVLDDFYPDLQWLKNYLNTSPFYPVGDVTYAGMVAPPPPGIDQIYSRLNEMLGGGLIFNKSDGQLRAVKKTDRGREKAFIHYDSGRLNIIVYLSDLPDGSVPENCGTHFYFSKKLKQKRFIPINEGKNLFQQSFVSEDTKNFSAWEEWHAVPYKKNRVLVFDGDLYHSPGRDYFGDTLGNSRMTQVFFPKVRVDTSK